MENSFRTLDSLVPIQQHHPHQPLFPAEMAAPADGYAPGINPDLVKEAMEARQGFEEHGWGDNWNQQKPWMTGYWSFQEMFIYAIFALHG